MKLSKKVESFKYREKDIIKEVEKRGVDRLNIYCASCGMNIVVAHYFLYKNFPEHEEYAKEKLEKLCKFYNMQDDLTEKEESDVQL